MTWGRGGKGGDREERGSEGIYRSFLFWFLNGLYWEIAQRSGKWGARRYRTRVWVYLLLELSWSARKRPEGQSSPAILIVRKPPLLQFPRGGGPPSNPRALACLVSRESELAFLLRSLIGVYFLY